MPRGAGSDLYERLVKDYGETERQLRQWWQDTKTKYNWTDSPQATWTLDFNSRQVTLSLPADSADG